MKKNVDQMTADLYNATKAAYLREFSGIIRNNGKCQPVTVDMMAQIANGRSVDGLALADGTDLKKVIDLMPGYSCGLASLPRIYKQVARLAGETCEKITVGGAVLNAYGLTDEQLNAKENKKILAVLKKYCPAPRKNDSREMQPFKMGVYHDSRRRCAVWSDARILIVAPWLYNDAAADVVAEPVAAHCVALAVVPVSDAEPAPAPAASRAAADIEAELSAAVIRCYYSSMQAQAAPLPPVDAYDVETLTANAAIIRCRRRGRSVLVAVSGSEGINNFSYSAVCLETGSTIAHGCRCGADGGYNKTEAMQAGINAAIKQYFDCAEVVADADSHAEQLPEPPAVVTVSAPYPPAPRRRRFAPRLRPVLHRLGRVAAVVLPLLIVALFIGASTASAPATDAAAVTTCQAAETVAQVVELPAVTVTAAAVTDAPAAPSPVKKLAAPSPVKNAAADAMTLPNQKTASDIATATAPAADDADSLTTAPAAPLAPSADADGLTICEGTPWAYTMMNWA